MVRGANGRPRLQLHGSAAERARRLGWTTLAVSLSHTSTLAMASVVAFDGKTEPDEDAMVE
ncbi:MAG: hypothetical protein NVS4B8_13490 [Herpetosiphon sp.]